MKTRSVMCAVLMLACSAVSGTENKILKLKNKIIEIQNKDDLGFQSFAFCSKILGFGSYVPYKESTIDKDDELLIYYEPRNLFTNRKEGLYEVWYTQDLSLLNNKSEVLQEWKDFLTFHYTSKKPVLDMFAQNSLDLKGTLAAGKYKVRLVLYDKLRGTSVTHVAQFQIQ